MSGNKLEKLNKGGIEFVLLILIAVGAFFLSGGQYIFNTLPKSQLDKDASSSAQPGGGENSDWKIEIINSVCDTTTHFANVAITLSGAQKGYYGFGLKEEGMLTYEFDTLPTQAAELHLSNLDNFNTKPWLVKLFEGGTRNGSVFTGGTLKATREMQATNCP